MIRIHVPTSLLLAAALSSGLATASPAQGGWRQWDVRLRDGQRLEANPLGAPDDAHLSLSVYAYDRRGRHIARARVQVIAAQPLHGDSLPAMPVASRCHDLIVRRDGTTTTGRITLARVRWSEGVVIQRGDTVDLRDVAYLIFASQRSGRGNCQRVANRQPPDLTNSGLMYPVGIRQTPTVCPNDCRT